MEVTRCHGTNREGGPCAATPQPGKDVCLWHDPTRAAERAEWSRRGGQRRSNRARAQKHIPDGVMTPLELRGLLGLVLKGVIAGKLEPGVGNAAANICRALTTIQDAQEFEEQTSS